MRRGEIWIAKLSPTEGAEIGKTRPVVIVSDDLVGVLDLKVVVPITDWKERFAKRNWMARLEPSTESGLTKVSAVDTFQIRSVSQTRLINQIGILSNIEMDTIANALIAILSL